jgi:hypothetical protein
MVRAAWGFPGKAQDKQCLHRQHLNDEFAPPSGGVCRLVFPLQAVAGADKPALGTARREIRRFGGCEELDRGMAGLPADEW